MSERNQGPDPYQFLHDNVDTVPQLESLILLWNSRPVGWTEEELASRLYTPPEQVREVLRDLMRLQIVQEIPGPPVKYSYLPRSEEQDDLMRAIDNAYRRDLVRNFDHDTLQSVFPSSRIRESISVQKGPGTVNAALYILNTLTTLLCAILLLRAWSRVRRKMLLWAGLCFAGLSVSYGLKFADLVVFLDTDLYTWRLATAALALALLLYGLIWESQ